MQLPIDVKALIDEATNIKAAYDTSLQVSVYVDDSAPADLVGHVRGSFASTQPNMRMTLSYLDNSFMPHEGDDIAVIVAGTSKRIGAAAAAIRGAGVPVMVATTLPKHVKQAAAKGDFAIPEGDVVAPAAADGVVEPIPLDDEAIASFDERMGAWIVSVCREKRLAFAVAFPFMRRSLAKDAVLATSIQNAGVGLVPIIPGADLPIMTLNQAKMVLQIAAAYGHDMDKERAKELAVVVAGAYISRALARELVEFVPILGFIIKPGIAYGATSAMGYAVMEYFEGGESVAGMANVTARAAKAGGKFVGALRSKASAVAPTLVEKYDEYAPKVASVVDGIVAKSVSAG